jgi:hypothetical protein
MALCSDLPSEVSAAIKCSSPRRMISDFDNRARRDISSSQARSSTDKRSDVGTDKFMSDNVLHAKQAGKR